MGQFKFILWLYFWYSQAEKFEFEWDVGNSQKSSDKHGVSTVEVESVFELKMGKPLGRQVSPMINEERLCIIGPSLDGRMLSIVFVLREGRVRPISSRLANKKEKKLYEEIRKATEGI